MLLSKRQCSETEDDDRQDMLQEWKTIYIQYTIIFTRMEDYSTLKPSQEWKTIYMHYNLQRMEDICIYIHYFLL